MTPTAVTATALAEPGLPPAPDFPFEAYLARSRAADLSGIAWDDVPRHPVPPEAVRTLRHMQDTESHTIVYLRALLATTLPIVFFGLTLRGLGLVLSLTITVLATTFAMRSWNPVVALSTTSVLVVACVAIFVFALGLPLSLFGPWIGGY